MAAIKQQIYCTFPKEKIRDPVLYMLGKKFNVIPNIRGATINDEMGIVFLELEGEADEVAKAVDYLRTSQVRVDTVKSG
ncbi:MAG: NIL domain-containing protein [Planctomycetes bacterium]|nr:NIL domain-containing protein [Planctomycetota bacterium]